jgi:hypothetical protein
MVSLHRVWCSKLTGPGVLLLGDAAHAVTPVGGQGANAALEDCLFLDGVLESTGELAQILLVPIPGSIINPSINVFIVLGGNWDPTDR